MITSSGFKELYPKFAIRDAGADTSRLPTASTCVNLLKASLQNPRLLLINESVSFHCTKMRKRCDENFYTLLLRVQVSTYLRDALL
jgi:hypothetical protein